MKYSWEYKSPSRNVFFSLVPIVVIGIALAKFENIESENFLYLGIAALFGINTMIQALKSRQKDVLTIERKTMYKKNVFGKKTEYVLSKYNKIKVDLQNIDKPLLVGFYKNENGGTTKDILLKDEYTVTLTKIKAAIDECLHITKFADVDQDPFFYPETHSRVHSDSLEQEHYLKMSAKANIVIAVGLGVVAIIGFLYYENTTELVLTGGLVLYILAMFKISIFITTRTMSVVKKKQFHGLLYLPGILLMITIAVLIFDN